MERQEAHSIEVVPRSSGPGAWALRIPGADVLLTLIGGEGRARSGVEGLLDLTAGLPALVEVGAWPREDNDVSVPRVWAGFFDGERLTLSPALCYNAPLYDSDPRVQALGQRFDRQAADELAKHALSGREIRAYVQERGELPRAIRGKDGQVYVRTGFVSSSVVQNETCSIHWLSAECVDPLRILFLEADASGVATFNLYAPAGSQVRVETEDALPFNAVIEKSGRVRSPTMAESSRLLAGDALFPEVGVLGIGPLPAREPARANAADALLASSADHAPDAAQEQRAVPTGEEAAAKTSEGPAAQTVERPVVVKTDDPLAPEPAIVAAPVPAEQANGNTKGREALRERVQASLPPAPTPPAPPAPPARGTSAEVYAPEPDLVEVPDHILYELEQGDMDGALDFDLPLPPTETARSAANPVPAHDTPRALPNVYEDDMNSPSHISLATWSDKGRSGILFITRVLAVAIDDDAQRDDPVVRDAFLWASLSNSAYRPPMWGREAIVKALRGPLREAVSAVRKLRVGGEKYFARALPSGRLRLCDAHGRMVRDTAVRDAICAYLGVPAEVAFAGQSRRKTAVR